MASISFGKSGLAKRWGYSRTTIATRYRDGELPEPSALDYYTRAPRWDIAVIEAFEAANPEYGRRVRPYS